MSSLFPMPPTDEALELPHSDDSTPSTPTTTRGQSTSLHLAQSPPSRRSPQPFLPNTVKEGAGAEGEGEQAPPLKRSMPLLSMDDVSVLAQKRTHDIRRVAFVGNYLPRKCGIATFTHDLRCGFAEHFPKLSVHVYAVTDAPDAYAYDPEVRFEFYEKDPNSYLRLVDLVEANHVDVVCLQHEYGIYGGDCGEHVLAFLRHVKVPVVTTLHTILEQPNAQQRRIMSAILRMSTRVVTMTAKGLSLLQSVYQADPKRVDVIPHGIPNFTFATETESYKSALGLPKGKKVILTFGLLSPNKGIEFMIRALPEIAKAVPDVVYVLLGQTHPHLIRERGEEYRHSLEWLANDLHVGPNLLMVNRFVDLDLLKEYIAACDVYVTPYLHEAQITSGTLSYAFGMGTAVVSTPYWHAVDLLSDGKGVLVPFRDPQALSKSVVALLQDDAGRLAMRQEAFRIGREMTWDAVAELYWTSFRTARAQPLPSKEDHSALTMTTPTTAVATTPIPLGLEMGELPDIKLLHLLRMTDDTGLIQFAMFDVPDYDSGYCTDDNARALTVTVKCLEALRRGRTLPGLGPLPVLKRAARTYLAFLQHAFDRRSGRFRNFLSYSRQWVDPDGVASEESHGRGMQAAGHCCQFDFHVDVAKRLFLDSIPALMQMASPRAIAHAMDGAASYLERFPNDEPVVRLMKYGSDRLRVLYREQAVRTLQHADGPWMWYEPYLTYSNSSLPMAMLHAGSVLRDPSLTAIGFESLRWLYELQLYAVPSSHHNPPQTVFSPIGCVASQLRGESVKHPQHDQQPIEGATSVLSALTAYRMGSNDAYWLTAAKIAAQWFMGRNCIGSALYDPSTGGCKDGLHPTGVNCNQGAESTLSFLLVLSEFLLI